jgi:hypothetical protein
MKEDPNLGFSLADIGEVAGRDKSSVSRRLGKRGARNVVTIDDGAPIDG